MRFLLIGIIIFSIWSCGNTTNSDQTVEHVTYGNVYDSLNAEIEKDLDNADLYKERSAWLKKQGQYEEAHADLDRAIAIDSSNGGYYVAKAELFIDEREIGKAKILLDQAIYSAPGSTDIMLKISEIYLWAGDYQEVINWSNAALGFDKYLAQAYYLKGMAHEYSKDTVKAVNSFQTAVEQDPNHYDSYMQLAKLYAIANHELADAYYTNAINARPDSIEAYYGRGLFRQTNNRTADARSDYDRILELEPNHVAASYNIGYVMLIQEEKVDSALTYFIKAATTAPNYADAIYMWGYCLELQSKYPEALEKYRATLEIQDTHTLAALGVGRLTKS